MRALELLNYLAALDDDGQLTALGAMMAEFPLDPQLSKLLISSPEFECSNEVLTIVSMLSGEFISSFYPILTNTGPVPNVFLRPPNLRKEADAAKQYLTIPEGDHLTLLNIYNNYIHSTCFLSLTAIADSKLDKNDKNWAWNNYLSARSLAQAENVRSQILRIMERFELECTSRASGGPSFYDNIRKTLVCGFFMQVAHRTKEKSNYKTMKDNQVRFHLCIRNYLLIDTSWSHCIPLVD
jgi:pre-mRNA-splicing factor ATP-dependent RNA helicase DHX15/PRP43